MPGKAGIEFLEQIRSSVRLNKMKVILMSGYLRQGDVLQAMRLGVKNVMVKPFTRQQLLTEVENVLKFSIQRENNL